MGQRSSYEPGTFSWVDLATPEPRHRARASGGAARADGDGEVGIGVGVVTERDGFVAERTRQRTDGDAVVRAQRLRAGAERQAVIRGGCARTVAPQGLKPEVGLEPTAARLQGECSTS